MIDFFIGGAPKCATSTLYEILKQHKRISTPKIKETHFFSYPEVSETYYDVKFVKTKLEFESLFSESTERIRGDFSPSYLFYNSSLDRIKKYNPSAKAIFVVRDPIERLKSHYRMDKRLGYVNTDIKKAIETSPMHYKEYIECSRYYEGISKSINLFGKNNVLVILFEDLTENPKNACQEIFGFLGIEVEDQINFDTVSNKGLNDKFGLMPYARKLNSKIRFMEKIPTPIKKSIKKIMFTEKPIRDNFDYNELSIYFKEDLLKLRTIIPSIETKWKTYSEAFDK
jgi:hypothetical protein